MSDSKLVLTYNQMLPSSPEELRNFYDQWADTYEQDYKQFGYEGPRVAAETLAKFLHNQKAKIIDLAAGTGMVGEQLQAQGFCNVDAIDMSRESLCICKEKGYYQSLICATIGSTPLDIPSDTYDALATCGSFMPGHLNQSCFPEITRIIKPGGFIVLAMREEYLWTVEEYKDKKLENAMQFMVDEGKWEVVLRKPVKQFYHDKDGIVFVFKIL